MDNRGLSFESTYPEWMLEGLRRLVQALKSPEAGLPETRIGHVAFDLCRILRNNAELADERRRIPEIGRQKIAQPVFIVGINRTGDDLPPPPHGRGTGVSGRSGHSSMSNR